MAHRVISDSEDEYDAPIGKSKVNRNNRIIDSNDEDEDSVDNPDINSFSSSSSSSDVYSESESIANESFSPLQVAHKRMARQRVILSDDEEEDPSLSQPDARKPASTKKVENEDDKDASTTASVSSREVMGDEANTPEGTGKERTEKSSVSGESNKENTSPPSNNLLPEKPAIVPLLGVTQAKPPLVQVPAKGAPQAVAAAQTQVPAYQLSHTRPALLKQLEYVKVRNRVIVYS